MPTAAVYPGQGQGTIPLHRCFIALRALGVKIRLLDESTRGGRGSWSWSPTTPWPWLSSRWSAWRREWRTGRWGGRRCTKEKTVRNALRAGP